MFQSRMDGKKHIVLLVLLYASLLLPYTTQVAYAAPAAISPNAGGILTPDTYIDELITAFQTELAPKQADITRAVNVLFLLLFTIQMAWVLGWHAIDPGATFGSMLLIAMKQAFIGMFFWWLIGKGMGPVFPPTAGTSTPTTPLGTILASFEALAGGRFNFAEILSKLWTLIRNIWAATAVLDGTIILGIATCVVLCYTISSAVALLAVVYLEKLVVEVLGFILMGFAGSEFTRSYAISYIKTLVAVGVKLFLVVVILKIGLGTLEAMAGSTETIAAQATQGWHANNPGPTPPDKTVFVVNGRTLGVDSTSEVCLSVMASAFLFHMIVQLIPAIAGSLLAGAGISAGGGTLTGGMMGLGNNVKNSMSTMAGMGIGAASVLSSGFKGGKDGAQKAANAHSEKISTDGGRSSVMSAIGGIGSIVAGGAVGALKGTAQAAIHEVATDLGSPSFKGSRSQRLFNSIAERTAPGVGAKMEPKVAGTESNSSDSALPKSGKETSTQSVADKTVPDAGTATE